MLDFLYLTLFNHSLSSGSIHDFMQKVRVPYKNRIGSICTGFLRLDYTVQSE